MRTKLSFQEKLLLMTMVVVVVMMIDDDDDDDVHTYRRQSGRVVRAQDLQFGGPKFKSRSDRY